ncbi:MAG TPA: 50S ribosomal protein L27 [Candidatus Jorgensenbacteria bacterium]|nr:50S ribosomal protein L27 [Candidatus Jorgensenbacteria bacterium]
MAHVKQKGGFKGSGDSISKRLGVKLFGGQKVRPGMVIVRQRGTKMHPGENVRRGKDDTLYAVQEGIVTFSTKLRTRFDGSRRRVKVVSVK